LLVSEAEDRQVRRGWLGCPSCRSDYPVTEGVPDLRLKPEAPAVQRPRFEDDELPLKLLALSGLAGERGLLLLDDRLAHAAPAVAAQAPELDVISVSGAPAASQVAGVSVILSDVAFPLAEYRLRCVAAAPGGDRELVAAAARRVAAGGRLVLFDATDADLEEARAGGLEVIAAQGGTVVAERRAKRPLPLL
jgi:uncharacterized protein YbaR (Trm112 family)